VSFVVNHQGRTFLFDTQLVAFFLFVYIIVSRKCAQIST
jgi:hypothetical protein